MVSTRGQCWRSPWEYMALNTRQSWLHNGCLNGLTLRVPELRQYLDQHAGAGRPWTIAQSTGSRRRHAHRPDRIGENGRTDDGFVTPLVSGVVNLLRVLKMAPGPSTPPRPDTRWFDDTLGVSATRTGKFTPAATTGRDVRRGEVIGTIRDYAGRAIETIVSPVDGYAIYGIAGPPVKAGDTVVTIGLPAKHPL